MTEHTQSVTERAGTEGRVFGMERSQNHFMSATFVYLIFFLDTVPKLNHPSVTLTCHQL